MGGEGGGGVFKKVLYGETPLQGPDPYGFQYSLSYTFHRKWYPFHILTVEKLSVFVGSLGDILEGPFKYLNGSVPFTSFRGISKKIIITSSASQLNNTHLYT